MMPDQKRPTWWSGRVHRSGHWGSNPDPSRWLLNSPNFITTLTMKIISSICEPCHNLTITSWYPRGACRAFCGLGGGERRGEVRGRRGCTCLFGRALNSGPSCCGPPAGAPRGPGLFTQQAVEEVSQHSFVGSGPWRTTSNTTAAWFRTHLHKRQSY